MNLLDFRIGLDILYVYPVRRSIDERSRFIPPHRRSRVQLDRELARSHSGDAPIHGAAARIRSAAGLEELRQRRLRGMVELAVWYIARDGAGKSARRAHVMVAVLESQSTQLCAAVDSTSRRAQLSHRVQIPRGRFHCGT